MTSPCTVASVLTAFIFMSGEGELWVEDPPQGLSRLSPSPAPTGSAFLATAPDLNGDGAEEVVVGAPLDGEDAKGRVQLLSGKDGELLFAWQGEAPAGRLGSAVAAWAAEGGQAHIALGAPGASGGRGRVGLIQSSSPESIRWIDGAEGQTAFGFALSGGRDVTGDGHADLVVGAPASEGKGSVALVDGVAGKVPWRVSAGDPAGCFGYDVTFTPDLNGDGIADVLVGHRGVGAVALSGRDGARLFELGEPALGRRIGDSVAALRRPSGGPLLVVGSGGLPGDQGLDEEARAELPDPGIFVFDGETRRRSSAVGFGIPGHLMHRTTVGLRLKNVGDFDGDGHDDLAICQPNGYLIYGPSGRVDLRSGAKDTKLGSTYHGGVRLAFGAYQFGTDACGVLRDGKRILVMACPTDGGVAAAQAGPEIGAKQGRDHALPGVWVRQDR
jgi:hypothetical protein